MRSKMTYKNSINQSFDFWSDSVVFNEGTLRDYSWRYNTSCDRVKSFQTQVVEKSFEAIVYSNHEDSIDELFEIIDYDILTKKPGKLYMNDCYLPCYIYSMKVKEIGRAYAILTIGVVVDEPFWIKSIDYSYFAGTSSAAGLNFPFNYSLDYSASVNTNSIINPGYTASDFVIKISGPVTNPRVLINNHVYQVNTGVLSGEYLVIDSNEKTIYKIANDGTSTNVFADRNKDSYIFEKIPQGSSSVSWVGITEFLITLYEKRSMIRWKL